MHMKEKLFFLACLLDNLMGISDDEDIKPVLLQIADRGFTDDIYSSPFYEKVFRTKADEFHDLCPYLDGYDDSTFSSIANTLERFIYKSSQRRYTQTTARPEEEGLWQHMQQPSE